MKNLLYLSIGLLLAACSGQPNNNSPATAVNLEGYSLQNFGTIQKATKKNPAGQVIEEGELVNDLKSGTWVSYYPEDGRIKTITSYVNGKKNGVHLELNSRGSVDLQCHYADDVFHGKWVKYKFGSRAEKEVNYNMGKIDGLYREFHNNGKMLKEVSYKNGIQDGKFRQFNDKEEVIMEYQYKDGEKISGGIVTPEG